MSWIAEMNAAGVEARPPEPGAMFLTESEIAALTGLLRPADQLRWLVDHGFTAMRNAAGRVVVTRAHAGQVLGSPDLVHGVSEPDWSAIQ